MAVRIMELRQKESPYSASVMRSQSSGSIFQELV